MRLQRVLRPYYIPYKDDKDKDPWERFYAPFDACFGLTTVSVLRFSWTLKSFLCALRARASA